MSTFLTEISITKSVAATLYIEIHKSIEQEQNYPSESDQWMVEMKQALEAIGEADRIVIQDPGVPD